MTEYVNPDVLVSTSWVADHLNDPSVRLVTVLETWKGNGASKVAYSRHGEKS